MGSEMCIRDSQNTGDDEDGDDDDLDGDLLEDALLDAGYDGEADA